MILIYGTSASGKSNIAEGIAVEEARKDNSPLVYLATMENKSQASLDRIKWHQQLREGKGFFLVEEMFNPEKIEDRLPFDIKDSVVLLECISNLTANVIFEDENNTLELCKLSNLDSKVNIREKCETKPELLCKLTDDITEKIIQLDNKCKKLIVVTNNVFTAGKYEDAMCDFYMQVLGSVNIELAKRADEFIEVIAGQMQTVIKIV